MHLVFAKSLSWSGGETVPIYSYKNFINQVILHWAAMRPLFHKIKRLFFFHTILTWGIPTTNIMRLYNRVTEEEKLLRIVRSNPHSLKRSLITDILTSIMTITNYYFSNPFWNEKFPKTIIYSISVFLLHWFYSRCFKTTTYTERLIRSKLSR